MALDAIFAVFALVMLARHGPAAARALAARDLRGSLVSVVVALLALAVLAMAVKGLAPALMR